MNKFATLIIRMRLYSQYYLVNAGCNVFTQPTLETVATVDLEAIQEDAQATANAGVGELVDAAKTEAVATAIAAITEDALLNPSPTNTAVVPTLATTTPAPTVMATIVKTLAKPPVAAIPTRTKTPYTDNCSVVSTSPKDYQVLTSGQDFDGVWVLKNTGMVTWTNGQYYISYLSGNIPHAKDVYYISGDVAVNDTVEVRADMVAPTASGTYVSNWAVINNVGMPFCYIFVAITIP